MNSTGANIIFFEKFSSGLTHLIRYRQEALQHSALPGSDFHYKLAAKTFWPELRKPP
jgi:hypothetical protein